ncbi:twin-arginine translocation pathway signal [Novosphingobium sp. PC22D]|uniref:murein L,D-transpeptidase catalytic domain-containing protein n=1 Tax=Novosphingobium sp. PC22D TaxID=1962403 RepID=UPI000BFB1201|nr:murein L,D-transpeptidase catalytic domain family protein [Novosphingobium sp. PC22D]PEQ14532.1 twin-arginine translocation pathway signal [Novosphingobium sp. PC22D]
MKDVVGNRGIRRRDVLTGGMLGAAALSLPNRVFAAASALTPYERRVFEVAKSQQERVAQHLWRNDLVGIADYGVPSWKPRLHFADLEKGTLRSFLIAHGRGSDPEHSGWLQSFSKEPGSEATSRGAYLTCEWYTGKYGTSIRLVGLDDDNSTALDRLIVMHPAWYVEQSMIEKWGKIGRSEGCFAMGQADFNEALWHLSGGRLLFADRIGEV